MSREIRFRLILEGKVVGYERWYRGAKNEPSGWVYSKDGKSWSPKYIRHDDKDQFTGLTNRNGVDVYEGDVIEIEHSADRAFGDGNPETFRILVKYEEDASFHGRRIGAANHSYSLRYSGSAVRRFEVIGNIHEHPELLEERV